MDEYRRQNTPTFGEVIRQRRVELGMTQEELAERVGESVRQSDISRMERDYVMLPRRARLEALARALDLSLGELLMRSGWMTQDETASVQPSGMRGEEPALEPGWGDHDVTRLTDLAGATDDWSSYSTSLSSLREAVSRSREISGETDEIIRRTREAATRMRPPRPRKQGR